MEPILPGAPWLIAHKSMLSFNQPQKITLNGKDYIIWQNQKGEVFALDNICPHLQAPLSEGWICAERNTMTCPFHALEFDAEGKLYKEGKLDTQPVTKTLKLIVKDDCIWTYGGHKPRLPIPELIHRVTEEYEFIGVTGEKSIQADFLRSMLVNYDYNHQNGTHKDLFKITSCDVKSYQTDGYYAKVEQQITRAENTLGEILKNPALKIIPRVMNNTLEYCFPSNVVLFVDSPVVSMAQTHVVYPETENITKTFILLYGKFKNPLLKFLFQKSFLQAAATVIEQDTTALESLYPRQKPKIRLPNEEIMFDAEKLYYDW
ncbi:MAG: Rieske 2Fe-2S domain-containing protein [Cyanobacteria bacterium P01_H01_bin.35]